MTDDQIYQYGNDNELPDNIGVYTLCCGVECENDEVVRCPECKEWTGVEYCVIDTDDDYEVFVSVNELQNEE